MEIEIKYELSAGKNAEKKYEVRNKFIQKLNGVNKAIEITKKKIVDQEKEDLTKKKEIIDAKKQLVKIDTKKREWFEKFRYFFTQNNFLVIAGRDAKNNELVVKRHLEERDFYFHAEVHGAPHVVLKNHLKSVEEIPKEDREQAAIFAGAFSSAWKSRIHSVDVYSVRSDQVTKTPNPGESLKTGAFVIRGKREYFRIDLNLAIGVYDKYLVCGPLEAIKNNCEIFFKFVPGDLKKSDFAKLLKMEFANKGLDVSLDRLISVLPTGEFQYA